MSYDSLGNTFERSKTSGLGSGFVNSRVERFEQSTGSFFGNKKEVPWNGEFIEDYENVMNKSNWEDQLNLPPQ